MERHFDRRRGFMYRVRHSQGRFHSTAKALLPSHNSRLVCFTDARRFPTTRFASISLRRWNMSMTQPTNEA